MGAILPMFRWHIINEHVVVVLIDIPAAIVATKMRSAAIINLTAEHNSGE
jgi:hypothetical protein